MGMGILFGFALPSGHVNMKMCWENMWDKRHDTQEKIAKAYDVTQQMVSFRINLHKLPDKVKEFTTQGLVTERQLVDILPLQLELYFSQLTLRRDKFLKMAEEGRRKQAVGEQKNPKYISVSPVLSDVDKTAQTLIYPEKPTEPSSEPKAKPEPRKPEKINVRDARAKTKTDPHDTSKSFTTNSEIVKSCNAFRMEVPYLHSHV